MQYFSNCHTLDDLKRAYRHLAAVNHPDHGGDNATMATINAEYAQRFQQLKKQHNASHDAAHQTTEVPEEFINIISALLRIPGLTVELCGCWLWISGDTRPNREALKAAGCRWSSSKAMWYWHHQEAGDHWSRGRKSMSDIRLKYGSRVFNASTAVPLEA